MKREFCTFVREVRVWTSASSVSSTSTMLESYVLPPAPWNNPPCPPWVVGGGSRIPPPAAHFSPCPKPSFVLSFLSTPDSSCFSCVVVAVRGRAVPAVLFVRVCSRAHVSSNTGNREVDFCSRGRGFCVSGGAWFPCVCPSRRIPMLDWRLANSGRLPLCPRMPAELLLCLV